MAVVWIATGISGGDRGGWSSVETAERPVSPAHVLMICHVPFAVALKKYSHEPSIPIVMLPTGLACGTVFL